MPDARRAAALALALVMATSATAADFRNSTSRNCLTSDTRSILEAAESHFGVRFKLASTCRAGAVIAGTHDPSQHRFGRAVDVEVPAGIRKMVLVRWFHAHARGVTMTYRNMAHVHFDTGPYHALVLGADAFGGRRRGARSIVKAITTDRAAQGAMR